MKHDWKPAHETAQPRNCGFCQTELGKSDKSCPGCGRDFQAKPDRSQSPAPQHRTEYY